LQGLKKVASKNELSPGCGKVMFVDDRPIALFNLCGEFVAIDNKCPHRGGSLGDGEIVDDVVACPWHGWEFNCRTGKAVENDAISVRTYDIENRSDGIFIKVG
jgi:nitrite reductase/ring-hydroxylating ferredoxin subunit|tara:strand:+ start:181 stop:489 length:309 start_codon:yes stop_codon:yes gene_type:complete